MVEERAFWACDREKPNYVSASADLLLMLPLALSSEALIFFIAQRFHTQGDPLLDYALSRVTIGSYKGLWLLRAPIKAIDGLGSRLEEAIGQVQVE